MSSQRFRILSLDGGGIKGAFSASFLASLEEMTGKRIGDHFDLIAGTSTGGIIALGLGLGMDAVTIRRFYEEDGPKIFRMTGVDRRWRWIRHWFASKHGVGELRSALERVLGERRLGESRVRLLIPSFDAVSGDIHIFKTAHHERLRDDYRRLAVDVALATSAAPTYLPMHKDANGQRFLDGGVWANSPAGLAILEAAVVLGQDLDSIDVLSVGATTTPLSVNERLTRRGVVAWISPLTDLLMKAQVAGAVAQAAFLTRGRVLRVNQTVEPRRFSLDDSKRVEELVALGRYRARQDSPGIVERFLDHPAEVFAPVYRLSQVGDTTGQVGTELS